MISSIFRETKTVILRPRARNRPGAQAGDFVGPLAVHSRLRGADYPRGIEVPGDSSKVARRKTFRAAFTLVDLLLTVALLLLLLGAMVFNFSTLRKGASLDEGTLQLEALLRFARAHAASTGRHVQINFEEEVGDGLNVPLGNLRVLWEPEPLVLPGVFEPLYEAGPYVNGIKDLISIEDVRPLGASQPSTARSGPGAALTAPADRPEQELSEAPGFAPLIFYPDGSSDSAEIVLASRDEDDDRRVALQFLGITGTFRRRILPKQGPELEPEPEEAEPASAGDGLPAGPEPRGADNR